MVYDLKTNPTGTRSIQITDEHLETLSRYALLNDLLDSNGIVDESVLEKLRLNARALLENNSEDTKLLTFCQQVLFHDNMKAFGLHQLILLYLDVQETTK